MDQLAELARVWRGKVLESRHFGVAAVSNRRGEIIAGWGDPGLVTYPRSSMKPFQALSLVESGAADAFRLTTEHLALACASHHGEPQHTDLVRRWLTAVQATPEDLACGPDRPRNPEALEAMILAGEAPCSVHHNCSGKHTGFLTVCRHHHFPLEGYAETDHPTHTHYASVLDALGAPVVAWARDGCTLPTPALTVGDAARIGALFAAGTGDVRRRKAMRTLLGAMRAHPTYVSGTVHPMEPIIKATGGRVVFKGGAEAFLLAFLEDEGLAIAIKVADGNPRGRVPALIAILNELGALSGEEARALAGLAEPVVYDSRHKAVGRIIPAIAGTQSLNSEKVVATVAKGRT